MNEKHVCEGSTYNRSAPWGCRNKPCKSSALLFEDGKWWCKIHAPSKVQERRDKSDRKYERDNAISKAECAVSDAERGVLVAVDRWIENSAHMDSWSEVFEAHQTLQNARAALKKLEDKK